MAKTQHHENGVRVIQRLRAREVGFGIRIDGAVLGVEREEDGTFEPMADGQNPGHLHESFFRAILLVAREKDNVPAQAGASPAFIHDGVRRMHLICQ